MNRIPIWFLSACFLLDPATSSGLRWRRRPREHFPNEGQWHRWNTAYAGTQAGSPDGKGYLHVQLTFGGRKRTLKAHSIVFALTYGRWPNEIDHINGVRSDNRPSNLREASRSENNQNLTISRRNTSGYLGVHWNEHARKWAAQIRVGGHKRHLGYFSTPEAAAAAYLAAKTKLHAFQAIPRVLGAEEVER